jgi:hypothetical protein
VITGVDVTNAGSDKSEMAPMLDQVQERCDQLPADWLMDGGFVSATAIETGADKRVRVLAPVPEPKNPDRDPVLPLPTDSPAVAEWRGRMVTPEAKATYQLRAATSECVNAQARSSHGLLQFRVRGLIKVLCVALWIALTHNLLIWVRHLQSVTWKHDSPAEPAGGTVRRQWTDTLSQLSVSGNPWKRCKPRRRTHPDDLDSRGGWVFTVSVAGECPLQLKTARE